MDVLRKVVHWKFLTLPGREKRVNNLLLSHTDFEVQDLTKRVLPMSIAQDRMRIESLRLLKGVGIAIASTILTFYDPENYGIYDIHVIREMYGAEPKYMFTNSKHYLKMLTDLRTISKSIQLPVRTIEKAYFKKNLG